MAEDIVQLVSFNLASETYGIDIHRVQEIIRPQHITQIPNAPEFVEGVINLRGRIIPVIDLRKRFKLPAAADTGRMRIVVIETAATAPGSAGNARTIGLIVDAVDEVLRLPTGAIEPPPSLVAAIGSEYLKGVGKMKDKLIILIDIDKILNINETAALGQSVAAATI